MCVNAIVHSDSRNGVAAGIVKATALAKAAQRREVERDEAFLHSICEHYATFGGVRLLARVGHGCRSGNCAKKVLHGHGTCDVSNRATRSFARCSAVRTETGRRSWSAALTRFGCPQSPGPGTVGVLRISRVFMCGR